MCRVPEARTKLFTEFHTTSRYITTTAYVFFQVYCSEILSAADATER